MRVSQRFRTECPVGLWTTRGQGQGHPCSMTLTFTRPIFSGRGRVHSVLTTQPDSPCYKKIAHLSFSRTFENTDRRTCCTVNFVHNIFKKCVKYDNKSPSLSATYFEFEFTGSLTMQHRQSENVRKLSCMFQSYCCVAAVSLIDAVMQCKTVYTLWL